MNTEITAKALISTVASRTDAEILTHRFPHGH
jgi:hypothetical protein